MLALQVSAQLYVFSPSRPLNTQLSKLTSMAPNIGTLGKRSLALLDAYLAKEPCEVGAILRNRSGAPYSRFTMPDDFAAVREQLFPKDKRTLANMRRSGAIELQAGGALPTTTAAKMANSISSANATQKPTSRLIWIRSDRLTKLGESAGNASVMRTNKGQKLELWQKSSWNF